MDIDRTLLARFRSAAPPYALYPCPAWFVEAFDTATLEAVLRARAVTGGPHLAISVAMPETVAARRGDERCDWPDWLLREAGMYREAIGAARVAAYHVDIAGALDRTRLRRVLTGLSSLFDARSQAAPLLSARLRPLHATPRACAALGVAGVTHLELDPYLPRYEREPSTAVPQGDAAQLAEAIGTARAQGIASVGAHLVLHVDDESGSDAAARLSQVLAAQPDHLSLHTAPSGLPNHLHAERLAQAARLLAEAAYEPIAQDVYARADAPLALTRQQGRLSRRPFGLLALPQGDTLGLGPGAFGGTGIAGWRNHRTPARYCTALAEGHLPVGRGVLSTPEDALRRAAMHSLGTHFMLDLEGLETAHGVDMASVCAAELADLENLAEAGVLYRDGRIYELTQSGRLMAGVATEVFDACRRRALARAPRVARL